MLHVNIAGLTGAEQATCTTNLVQLACDPIYFLAIGHRPAGQARWDIIDDQITPVRGFGQHDLEMNGIAERLVRSEEHTSELQSLMRISYAVFCLKKKKNNNTHRK